LNKNRKTNTYYRILPYRQ